MLAFATAIAALVSWAFTVPLLVALLDRRPEDWSAEEKLEVVLRAQGLAEAELGEFLRRRGVHEEQLGRWRETALESLKAGRRGSPKSGDTKRIKELERELRRKEKALAEAAALLVLREKPKLCGGRGRLRRVDERRRVLELIAEPPAGETPVMRLST